MAANPAAGRPVCSVAMRTAAELVRIARPSFQRAAQERHVLALARDIAADWRELGELSVLQSISVAEMADGSTHVLDGQHRLAALSRLSAEIPLHRVSLPVVAYRCATGDDARRWFRRINHSLPASALDLELAWSAKARPLLESIQARYPRYISGSTAPQCPNVSVAGIQDALQQRAEQLRSADVTAENLASDVEELHREVVRRMPAQLFVHPRLAKCVAKQPGDPCLLGLWRRHEWVDLVLHRRIHGLDWGSLDFSAFSPGPAPARRAVPAAVRRLVWSKTNDPASMAGACHICGEDLAFPDMECAHDVPHCLGGGATVDNMWASCRGCNRDMGIRRLGDYRDCVARMRGDARGAQGRPPGPGGRQKQSPTGAPVAS